MASYYYWVAASTTDNEGVGDTGTIVGRSAQDAAERHAAQLSDIEECDGQVVRARSADMGDTGEAVVRYRAVSAAAAVLGRKGGSVSSPQKAESSRANAKRPRGHVHRAVRSLDREQGFAGCVSKECDPRSHGNITVVETCRCGMTQYVNRNQGFVERGRWS